MNRNQTHISALCNILKNAYGEHGEMVTARRLFALLATATLSVHRFALQRVLLIVRRRHQQFPDSLITPKHARCYVQMDQPFHGHFQQERSLRLHRNKQTFSPTMLPADRRK